MNLTAALTMVAAQLHLDVSLLDYPAHDPHGGYPEAFPTGSMWQVEGQFLYSLIRALKPLRILEIGTSHGCSATHMLQAQKDNGNHGVVVSIDNQSQVGLAGDMIPRVLTQDWIIYREDLYNYLTAPDIGQFDFILEDAMHSPEQVAFIWSLIPTLLRPGGVMVSHDAAHHLVGKDVMTGIAQAGYDAQVYAIDPADCGFAVWRATQTVNP